MKEYVTVDKTECVTETVIDKSRFIASVIHVDSVEQAVEYVNSKRKKYYDATHNVYAYVVGGAVKYSDDGEPQGTAGLPVYECIKNNSLDYLCVVVTRYFGGIKLGAGGLVRAYSGSCADVLHTVKHVAMRNCTVAEVTVEYSLLAIVRKALQGSAKEIGVTYGDKVTLQFLFLTDLSTTIADIVVQNTLGKGIFEVKNQLLCEYGD